MGRPSTRDDFGSQLIKARYAVLRLAGVPSRQAGKAAAGGPSFAKALLAAGGDPTKHPALAEERRGGNPAWRKKAKRGDLPPSSGSGETSRSEET